MGIKQRLEADIKTALLGGDKKRVEILRVLKGAVLDLEIAEGKRQDGLSEQQLITLFAREAKKRQDAAQLYIVAGEQSRADAETAEKEIIDTYLPEQMSDEQLGSMIDKSIADIGGELTQQLMGKVIANVRDASEGAVDGSRIAAAVKARLAQT